MSADPSVPQGTARHLVLVGDRRRDRAVRRSELPLPTALVPAISAHRRVRGPYTFAGTLIRAIVPDALIRQAHLVRTHEVELLTVAPELRDLVPARLETLTSLSVPEERTRFYSRLRTRRIAHGLTEFVRDLLIADAGGTRSLVIEDLDHADPTDREFVAVLIRRLAPELLTVVVGGTAGVLVPLVPDPRVEPGTPVGEDLPGVLARCCLRIDAAPVEPADRTEPAGPVDPAALVARYVADDGTDDDPFVLAAYEALPVEERRALHDRRADELVAGAERTHGLGAIPYHREQGSDPHRAGVVALAQAMDACLLAGFYDATLDFCARGRALTDWREQPDFWWLFTGKMPTSLSALGRVDEVEAICDQARARSRNPAVHIQCAYSTSMLYTRHRNPSRRDHERALGWINEAIALASLLPDPRQRAFNTVFHNNGLALIEGHMGRPEAALELVTAGIAELDRDLGADGHHLHRSVLRHNRATVLTGLRRFDEALADYREVIAVDPHYPEYHLDLGNLLRLMGREQEALAEYETALRLGPPIPEVYYNRADVRTEAGDVEGALADLDYVLELDPDFLDAYVNRAGLHLDLGDPERAERDAAAGLTRDPDNAHLLAVLGRVYAERAEDAAAEAAFDRALRIDPDLTAALCGRADLAYRRGDMQPAIADLARAVELVPDDPAVRYNRAFILQEVGRWDDALADLDVAAGLVPDDEDIRAARRECLARVPAAT